MANQIKTSDENWVPKASKLYFGRVDFSIIDDSKYGLNYVSDKLSLHKKTTLNGPQLLMVTGVYLLAIVSIVLLVMSFSLDDDRMTGIILSSIGFIVFVFVPTYYVIKNKAPEIEEIDNGYSIKF